MVIDSSRGKCRSFINSLSVLRCVNCTGSHSLANCKEFQSMSVRQRNTFAREKRVCFNCLQSGHFIPKCPNESQCMHCRRMHHSLLHLAEGEITNVTVDQVPDADDLKTQTVLNASFAVRNATVANVQTARTEVPRTYNVLLTTAWVDQHRCVKVRALLDQGSSFISEFLCQILRIKRQHADLQIRCFGENYIGHERSKIALCNKCGPIFPLMVHALWKHYVIHSLPSSASQVMAILTRSYTSGSQSSESGTDSFSKRSWFI
jgi:hypothetical protein